MHNANTVQKKRIYSHLIGSSAITSISERIQIHHKNDSQFSGDDRESHRKYRQTRAMVVATLNLGST